MSFKNINFLFIIKFIVLLSLQTSLLGQVDVDFTSDKRYGCGNLSVQFINNTPNPDVYTYLWDFGNGNISTEINPIATYTKVGAYAVSLKLFHNGETILVEKEDYVVVYEKPEVGFMPADPIVKCAPFEVHFNSFEVSESSHNTYVWDFGDGNISYDKNPIHVYQDAGEYSVSVVMETENGCVVQSKIDKLVEVRKPKAFFDASLYESCSGTLECKLKNLSYGLGTLNFRWDFGDGQDSQDYSPTHLYEQSGIYDVKLVVADELGCSDSLIIQDYIEVSNTIASFDLDRDTVCINELIKPINTSENSRKYYWDFGDGAEAYTESPEHRYGKPGNYTIVLNIENYECKSSVSKKIHVVDLNVNFSVSDSIGCEYPLDITYNAIADEDYTYEWHLGNGYYSTEKNPVVRFERPVGIQSNTVSYTDTLIVTDSWGCSKELIKKDNVTISIPEIEILSDNNFSGCKPLALNMSYQIDYDLSNDSIDTKVWKVDGVEAGSLSDLYFSFNEVGEYEVTLETETQLGCTTVVKKMVEVGDTETPDFRVVEKNVFCGSEMVLFEDLSEDKMSIDNYLWEFGDGRTIAMGIPLHQYVDTGYMDVTLNVSDNGCWSKKVKEDYVYIKGPIATIKNEIKCEDKYTAFFNVDLIDVDEYVCYFGDGDSIKGDGNSFNHLYKDKGSYEVILATTNIENQCKNETKIKIEVADPVAVFDTVSIGPCKGNSIEFDPSESIDAFEFYEKENHGKYYWDFGDGSEKVFSDSSVSHIYKSAGTFYPKLMIKDKNGCSAVLSKEIDIYMPDVSFSSNYKEGCIPVLFEFENNTKSYNDIVMWEWDFGDGHTSDIENPTHSFGDFGSYNVSLYALDDRGCFFKRTYSKGVSVVKPDANFKVSDASSCINDTLLFSDKSLSNIEQFLWDFGDGNNSVVRNPGHIYTNPGEYDVSLKIIDDHGCEAIETKSNFVSVQEPPHAEFVSDKNESGCYPFLIKFEDMSESPYLAGWKWIFGDGLDESVLQNPNHIYTKPGEYDVTLISYTSNGCSDSLTYESFIKIGGPYAEIDLVDSACIENELAFSVVNEKNLTSILWDFGDGKFSYDTEAFHKYNRKGNIYPSLILKSNSGNSCDKVITDSVYIYELVAEFSFVDGKEKGCVPFLPAIKNTSKQASHYKWFIDGEEYSEEEEPNFKFDNSGLYNLKLLSGNTHGCIDTMNSFIEAFPLPKIELTPDTFICLGQDVLLWAKGGESYLWDNKKYLDEIHIDSPIATPDISTVFKVKVFDKNRCSSEDSVLVLVQQLPFVELNDTSIIIGESVKLNIDTPYISSFNWNADTEISCSDCPNPELTPLNTRTYIVEVTDTSNCFTTSYPIEIEVQKKYSVDFPTAFTPNGDGVNDVAKVMGWGIKRLNYLKIFNRFGEKVYESNSLNQGWDGSYKGKRQSGDVYNYILEVVTYADSILEKKGSIRLIR